LLDLATRQAEIGSQLAQVLSQDLESIGIQIPTFIIENISLPPEVEQALDKRTQMGIVGDLNQYTQFQAANAMEQAAGTPGGGLGEGLGLGMGIAAGQRMAASLGPTAPPAASTPPAPPAAAAPVTPPPLPVQDQWFLGVGGQQLGPYDTAGLAAQVSAGTLTATTLVWKQGMAQWTPAGQVPELVPLLGSIPPPLPPQPPAPPQA